jgi:hypothetical protein
MKLLTPGKKVAWIGDSHSEALGPRMARMLPAELGIEFVRPPEARRGWSVRSYNRSGDVPALVQGAEVVIVELGGNDAAAQIGPEGHTRDVQRMMQSIGSKKVIWIGPGVTLREDLERYRGPIREAQRRVVEGWGLSFPTAGGVWIDSQPLTRSGDLRSDQVHFSRTGYDHWAAQLLPQLREAAVGGAGAMTAAVGQNLWWIAPAAAGGAALFAVGAFLWSRR